MVFLSDNLLRVKPATVSSPEANSPSIAAARFFRVTLELPLELQMVLCHRMFGSTKDVIRSKDSEGAFKRLAKVFVA